MTLISRQCTRRLAAIVAALALLTGLLPVDRAGAEGLYPARPVRIVVPFAAGGVADITARLVADRLGAKLGSRFYIENQPGAGGITAARTVMSAQPDGYTLALLSNGTAISASLFKKLPFDPVKDFAPVSTLGFFDFLFVVRADAPFKTMEDFIKAGKQSPGRFNVGTIILGSTQNLAAGMFRTAAGIDFVVIPHRGTPEVLVSLLQGNLDMAIDSYSALKGSLDDGKIRALAASGPLRSKITPNVPTLRENGLEVSIESWNALFAPASTPPAVISTLNRALQEVLADPALKKQLLDLGVDARGSTPDQLATRLRTDIEKWKAVIDASGIEKQ
ncbi:tripartite tricarboxylate transporter substrate binding protein [Rhodopseudomonas palustris]|uniref:Bug family tripartite tricarboxylate transporter substrate binding protein n=1 Tax=Rhodopseudomonas palustris TaxID=1076 RepID=UPI002ACE17FC|nr:tripartite tricarboxylate transporter substrate binding protein [Rhodopseudomonas palustris]WQG98206.1 tripartite tricarboxylate transporter substrate binding protein [Rhodopseudomonas palustris]